MGNNNNNQGRTYEEKSCCTVGEEPRLANTLSYDEVKALVCVERNRVAMIVGIVVGSVAGVCILITAWYCYRKRINPRPNNNNNNNNNTSYSSVKNDLNFPISSNAAPLEDDI